MADLDLYNLPVEFSELSRDGDQNLTDDEKNRFFYYARSRAIDCLLMARQLMKLNFAPAIEKEKNEALMWLEVAKSVYPFQGDGDSISIEDIIMGKEPGRKSNG